MVLPQGAGRGSGSAPGPSGDASTSALGASAVGSVAARVPFDARLRALARVFDLASGATKVDFPICADCAAEVHRELEAAIAEAQEDAAAYEAALAELEAEGAAPREERAFQRELRRLHEEAEAEE